MESPFNKGPLMYAPTEYESLLATSEEGDTVAQSIGKAKNSVKLLNEELAKLNAIEADSRPED